MFGIGILELVVIFIVALVVLGPNQLPDVARTIGIWFFRLKKTAQLAQTEMEEEFRKMEEGDIKKDQGEKSQTSDGNEEKNKGNEEKQ